MSSSIPSLKGREVVQAFQSLGFEVARISGSHHIMKKDGHENLLSVPVHGSDTIRRGTLKGLVQAAGITMDEFISAVRD